MIRAASEQNYGTLELLVKPSGKCAFAFCCTKYIYIYINPTEA